LFIRYSTVGIFHENWKAGYAYPQYIGKIPRKFVNLNCKFTYCVVAPFQSPDPQIRFYSRGPLNVPWPPGGQLGPRLGTPSLEALCLGLGPVNVFFNRSEVPLPMGLVGSLLFRKCIQPPLYKNILRIVCFYIFFLLNCTVTFWMEHLYVYMF